MRVIKFRAWDGTKMYSNPTSPHMESFFLNDAIETAFLGVELMQFTGLTDKNGKEIYEGDVVRLDSQRIGMRPPTKSRLKVIEWVRNDMFTGFGIGKASVEIIGNIYENPELLKV